MYTPKELSAEFWQLTKSVLQDERVDTEEAGILKRWLEEHHVSSDFDPVIAKLANYLKDGYIDPFESKNLCNSIGRILALLRAL